MTLPDGRGGEGARDVAHRCAVAAGAIIRAAAARPRPAATKDTTPGGRRDIVTETDPAVERAVVEIIDAAFPEHGILGEEGGVRGGVGRWRWVVDPVDGTRNFAAGVPWHAFNLALYDGDEPRLGLTLDALRDEIFYAEAGGGASLNGVAIGVTPASRLADATLAFDLGYDDRRGAALLTAIAALFPGVQALRLPGTVALGMAYVAAGRFDAYVHPSPYAWDFAPGVLLVREAGGVVTEFDGTPLGLAGRSVIAAGPALHAEVLALVQGVEAVAGAEIVG